MRACDAGAGGWSGEKHVTLGNPSPVVVDGAHVLLAFCRDNKAVLTLRPDAATGTSWPATPVDVSARVMTPGWPGGGPGPAATRWPAGPAASEVYAVEP